jgi:hypothetical protein
MMWVHNTAMYCMKRISSGAHHTVAPISIDVAPAPEGKMMRLSILL